MRGAADHLNAGPIPSDTICDLLGTLWRGHRIVLSDKHQDRTRNALEIGPEVYVPRIGIQMRSDLMGMPDHSRAPFVR